MGREGPVTLGGAKRRGLLALLVVHAGQVVSLDHLVDALWSEHPSKGARGTVQTYLSQLRKLFAASKDITLETRAGGYVLQAPTGCIDASRFEQLCAQAVAEPHTCRRLQVVDEALELWRGPPLGEFAGAEWADLEATRLEGLHLQALQQRIDALLDLGRHAEVIPELEGVIGEHRLDEHFWAQLMLAYYRAGRQADALRAYQEVRSVLADELGIEPGAELADLERKILDHDPALTLTPEQAQPMSPESLPEGVVTFLLTDLEKSTPLWDQQPQAMAAAVARHEEIVGVTVRAHRGGLIKSGGEGDSTLSVFPRASDAAAAAITLDQALAAESGPEGLDLRTRIALHTGEAHLRGDDYYGGALNRAARIRALARGGEVLCSRSTAEVVADTLPADVHLQEVGTYDLKGLDRDETVYALVNKAVSDTSVAERVLDRGAGSHRGEVPLPARLGVDGVFVGRERECAQLDAAFAAIRDRDSRGVVLVAGEPGIGKTTLAARFARAAHNQGAAVLYGHSDEGLAIPFQPWAEALAHLVRHVPDATLKAHVAARGSELRRLVPELSQRVNLPALVSTDPEADRYVLFGATVDLLARASSDAPLLLVLEDLHWADLPSLQLLRHIVGAEASKRLLVVATYRDSDISEDDPVAATLAALHREPGVERVTLSGLGPDAIAQLLEAASGRELDTDGVAFRDTLAAETDGNPFFVTEVLRDLTETGSIRTAADEHWAEMPLRVPATVRAVIMQRVARLGAEGRRVLSAGAVIGPDFDLDLLARATDIDEHTTLDALDAATVAALVRPGAGGADSYTFVHALIARALLEALSPARRRRVHARVAAAFEDRYCDNPGDRIGALARHWLAAGEDPGKAIDYCCRAGAHALALLAPDEALRWYRQALEVLERTAEPDDPRRGAVLVGLGDAQRLTGDPIYRETLLAAAEIAQRLSDTDLLVRAAVTNTSGVFSRLYDADPERLAVLEAARAATEGRVTPERAQVLATLAGELAFCDRIRMRAVADEAFGLARSIGDDPTLVIVAFRLEPSVRAPDNLTERVTLAAEACTAAERTGDPVLRWTAASGGILPALEAGDIEAFHARIEVAERLANEIGQPLLRYFAGVVRTLREALAGRLDRAERFAYETLELGGQNGQPEAFIYYAALLLSLRLDQGRLGELVDFIDQAVAATPDAPQVRAARALVYCELGRTAEARSIVEAESANGFRALPFDLSWANAVNLYARVVAALGDRRAAAQLVELIKPWRDQIASSLFGTGSLAHALGLVLATIDRHDEAEDAFEQAAAVHERIAAPILLAQTHLEWARLLSRRDRNGDRKRARELTNAAHSVAAEVGAGAIERGARELLKSLHA
jgi:DNA-binding SARP family transcriptional activator